MFGKTVVTRNPGEAVQFEKTIDHAYKTLATSFVERFMREYVNGIFKNDFQPGRKYSMVLSSRYIEEERLGTLINKHLQLTDYKIKITWIAFNVIYFTVNRSSR